ncbi:uncharacterized protein LOC116995175 [Catharus ustulatus]|uniref:uncharacterized protein LOC116995175 n=1 Tax=Catharus ustulatus TaxID=91951 RepID=UPI00140DEDA5|nr:uncharacterized protein LOC116995175 [Catharus ustulatus]
MGGGFSQEQIHLLATLKEEMSAHPMAIPDKELKSLLLWVRLRFPSAEANSLFEPSFWEQINRSLYHLATQRDKEALELLSPARVMLEVISHRSANLQSCRRAILGPSGAEGGSHSSQQLGEGGLLPLGHQPVEESWYQQGALDIDEGPEESQGVSLETPGSPEIPRTPYPRKGKLKLEIFPSELEDLDFCFYSFSATLSPERGGAVQAPLGGTGGAEAETGKAKTTADTAGKGAGSVRALAGTGGTQPIAAAAGTRRTGGAGGVRGPASIPGAGRAALTSSPGVGGAEGSMPIAGTPDATCAVSAGAAAGGATVRTVGGIEKTGAVTIATGTASGACAVAAKRGGHARGTRNTEVSAIGTESPEVKRGRSRKQSDSSNESEVGGSSSEGAETSDSEGDQDTRGGVSKGRATSVRAAGRRGRDRSGHTPGALQAGTGRAQAGGVSLGTDTAGLSSEHQLPWQPSRQLHMKAIIESLSQKLQELCEALKSFSDPQEKTDSKKAKQKAQSTLTGRTSGGRAITLQDFFPISYKKSSSKKTLQASEGIPAWAAGASASGQGQSIMIPKEIVKAFLQHMGASLESHPEMRAEFPQIFRTSQESQILVPQPGPGTAQRVQVPAMPVSEAAWIQTQQVTPFYRSVPMEAQPSAPQTLVDWADIRRNLARDRACPMIGTGDIAVAVNYDAQGQNPKWERLTHEVIKDLIRAIRGNGLGSSYFRQLLKDTFNIYDLTPYDLRSLVSLILTDTQALIWDGRWRRALQELRTKYQGGPNAALTLAQLAGDPPEDNPAQQARLPRNVLIDIKEAARKAILQIAPAGMQDTIYTEIKQGASESYSSYIDRLTQAVDRQVTDEAAKPHLLKSLAFANANQECKRVISAIPGQPSLAEMVEACSIVGTPQHIVSIVEERMERLLQVHSETFEKVLANFKKQKNPTEGQCYKCGNFGHFKKNCPHLVKKGKSSGLCLRCRRGKHPASECYSQTDVDGKQLPMPGNYKKSANRQRVMTEVMTQGTATSQTGQFFGNINQMPSAGQLQASPATQTYCPPQRNVTWQLPK